MTEIAADQRAEPGGATAWLGFAGCLIAVFMQMIDVTIVNTALPAMTADLSATRQQQLLFVTAYSLAFACTLLTAARLGQLLGRRAMFLGAVVAFTAASVWCGMADSAVELVAARTVQGAAGAGMGAQTIAILTATFPRRLHGQVFALYGGVAGFAGMLGPILGGALVTANPWDLGWHSVFMINLPLGVLAFALGARYLKLGRPRERVRFDPGGAVLSTVSLFALLYALTDLQQHGWRAVTAVQLGVALLWGAVFIAQQRRATRHGADPLLRFDLFADRGFAIGAGLVAVFFGLFTAFVFTVSVTLQDEMGLSPWHTGLLMTPFALGAGAGAVVSPIVVGRWGVRTLAAGMALYAGCIAFGTTYLYVMESVPALPLAAGPIFLSGLGVGLFGVQLQPIMLSALDQARMDAASGLLPTVEQIGNGLGLALLSAVFFRSHSMTGSITMFAAIAVVAALLAIATLALPEPAARQ
ncbi:MFS transporter [Nocardia sp. NPDC005978]|uniref:MFS transporter n=1 Tax=Nocardia sp. NPDC005978 TaxID=3156725 RepID=UPI0033A60CF2